MTYQEITAFEQKLLARGYKHWDSALYGTEDYDVSKLFRDGDTHLYQIIFKFWDWRKYNTGGYHEECAVDAVIMPCFDGRADLELCSIGQKDKVLDIEWVENVAKDFYEFITSKLK